MIAYLIGRIHFLKHNGVMNFIGSYVKISELVLYYTSSILHIFALKVPFVTPQ